MRYLWTIVPAAVLALAFAAPAAPEPVRKPKVEVVFCLDTTGSMGGLIDGAKAKIDAARALGDKKA